MDQPLNVRGCKIISRQFHVPFTTAANIIKKHNVRGTVAKRPEHRCKRKCNPRLIGKVVQMVENEPKKTLKNVWK